MERQQCDNCMYSFVPTHVRCGQNALVYIVSSIKLLKYLWNMQTLIALNSQMM